MCESDSPAGEIHLPTDAVDAERVIEPADAGDALIIAGWFSVHKP